MQVNNSTIEPNERIRHEQRPRDNTYFGFNFEGLSNYTDGIIVENVAILDPAGDSDTPQKQVGSVRIRWTPESYAMTNDQMAGVSSASGGLLGLALMAAALSTSISPDSKGGFRLTRRNLLKSAAASTIPVTLVSNSSIQYAGTEMTQAAASRVLPKKHTSDPMRVILGSRYPDKSISKLLPGNVEEIQPEDQLEILPSETQMLEDQESHTFERIPVHYKDGKTEYMYVVRPKPDVQIKCTMLPAYRLPAYIKNAATISATLPRFAEVAAKGHPALAGTLYGFSGDASTRPCHTVPDAVVYTIDGTPIAVSSMTWSHPLSMTYAPQSELEHIDGRPATITEKVFFSSKAGTLAHLTTKEVETIKQDLVLWKSKLTQISWSEGFELPIYHHMLRIENGVPKLVDDQKAWNEIEALIETGELVNSDLEFTKPGTVIDLDGGDLEPVRSGDVIQGMSVNGMILDATGNIAAIVTMNQDVRFTSQNIVTAMKQAFPDGKYYVVGDEHDGGGMVYYHKKEQVPAGIFSRVLRRDNKLKKAHRME
jgi:hypothetical protein